MKRIEFFGISGGGKTTLAHGVVDVLRKAHYGSEVSFFQHENLHFKKVLRLAKSFTSENGLNVLSKAAYILLSTFSPSIRALPRELNLLVEISAGGPGQTIVLEESLIQGCWSLQDMFGCKSGAGKDAAIALARLAGAGGAFVWVDIEPQVALRRIRSRGRNGRLEALDDNELSRKLAEAREYFKDVYQMLAATDLRVAKVRSHSTTDMMLNQLIEDLGIWNSQA